MKDMAAERALEVARGFFYLPLLRMWGLTMAMDPRTGDGHFDDSGLLRNRFMDLYVDCGREFTWPTRPMGLETRKRMTAGWLEKEVFEDWIEHDLEEADRPLWQGQ